ncbi:MAG: RNA-binding transcriptional accessory protein [Deltaproteobacteria bacterium]|nr:RNA-binding transcriptional accessory protein [Deltaproteobacteria bacterium]
MVAPLENRIAEELGVRPRQVAAAVALLDSGATVPFIARYRKEATEGLDDNHLRTLAERLGYLREMDERRAAILASIEEQGKLTPELRQAIDAAASKQLLEDLYLPFKPRRRTKAQIAREAGIEPLALSLLHDPTLAPPLAALSYVNAEAGFADVASVLDGARQILVERFGEDAELLTELRQYLLAHAVVVAKVIDGKEAAAAKYRDYFGYREPFGTVPSHRALAIFRGRNEDLLRVSLQLDDAPDGEAAATGPNPCEQRIAKRFDIADRKRAADLWLCETVHWAWRTKISMHLEVELLGALRERADDEAIRVFANNLKDLLLAAPAGPKVVIGLDPGLRTGVKVAVVDRTGKLLDTATIYPHPPKNAWEPALQTLLALAGKHRAELIAIGNGTASRETDKLATKLIGRAADLRLARVVVSEAGASVYSASAVGAAELPDLDVSLRGAASIARRLQDPLAELVKIEPKSIGVGQYQHDVSQPKLGRALDAVVEDCVNAVGVDANTASAPLLARISGLNAGLAAKLVAHRDAHGAFGSRAELRQVPRLGDKTFEQAAGFLRIMNGVNPLDASAVHPEAYPVVERILAHLHKGIGDVLGNTAVLRGLDPKAFVDERFGLPTVADILKELEKPGRDPRPEFKTATFREGVATLADLAPGMILEGVVSNVAAFGAFVDIGVHQDGLVHISAMSNRFVKDPREVVHAGDVVKVKVLSVDLERQRIALTMRLDDAKPQTDGKASRSDARAKPQPSAAPAPRRPEPSGIMAAAFQKLKDRSKESPSSK